MRLSPDLLTLDQQEAIDRLYGHDCTFLVAGMGSGKTVITLTAIAELQAEGALGRVLVVAPLKVCNEVWAHEAGKWDHLQHMKVAVATGTPAKRDKALKSDSDVLVINFENLPWLLRVKKAADLFTGLVVDELSKFKSGGGTNFKAIRPHILKWGWRVGMTGTPVAEDFMGLYGQMMVVDGGAALGTRKEAYKRRYFDQLDYMGYDWGLKHDGAERLTQAIADTVYTVPDYQHQLPPISYQQVPVVLPYDVREVYATMAKDMTAEGGDLTADNAAVLTGKLQQLAGGFYYDDCGDTVRLSHARVVACGDLVRGIGAPVVLAYWYKADLEALQAELSGLRVATVGDTGAIDQWNRGELDALLLHPRSAGHGLNLAAGGCNVVWYAPQWSRDLWEQTNARLWRRGQTKPVTVYTLCAVDTVDELVVSRVEDKGKFGTLLKQHLEGVSGV